MKNLKLALVASIFFGAVSCGKGAGVGVTTNLSTPTPTATPIVSVLPTLQSLFDESINTASASYVSGQSAIDVIANSSSAAPIGAYTGAGTGHKAIISSHDFHQTPLSTLTNISYEYKTIQGSGTMYLAVFVDLDCSLTENPATDTLGIYRANRKTIIVNGGQLTSSTTNGYTAVSINAADLVWTIGSGPFGGLPSNQTTPGAALSSFLANYPNACIINGIIGDAGLGRTGCATGAALTTSDLGSCAKTYGGIALINGSSGNLAIQEFLLRKFSVQTTSGVTTYQ